MATLLLDEVRLWDGAVTQTAVDVLLVDGRVVAVADEIAAPADARVIDGAGLTALPGLIDSHVHLSLVPGGALRGDTPEVQASLLTTHMKAYLACGVTTVLDPAVTFDEWSRIDAALSVGVGPRFLALGPPVSPVGGYVAVVLPEFPSVADSRGVDAQLDALVAHDAVGVKVTVEPGLVGPIWPLHEEGVREAIRAGAPARHLPVYVHARTPETWAIAIDELDAHAIVHGLDRPHAPTIAKAAAAHVYVMPTLSVLDAMRAAWQPERLHDPGVIRAVPPLELETAADPAQVRRFERFMITTAMPHAPLKGLIAQVALSEGVVAGKLRKEFAAVKALRDAGVPLVMGSDSGNWPIMPFEFHGPTSVRELELMVEAGLTPEEALRSATTTAAAMLGRADLGKVAPGSVGDLVLVRGDPLADVSVLRDPAWVVVGGVADTPAGWMAR